MGTRPRRRGTTRILVSTGFLLVGSAWAASTGAQLAPAPQPAPRPNIAPPPPLSAGIPKGNRTAAEALRREAAKLNALADKAQQQAKDFDRRAAAATDPARRDYDTQVAARIRTTEQNYRLMAERYLRSAERAETGFVPLTAATPGPMAQAKNEQAPPATNTGGSGG